MRIFVDPARLAAGSLEIAGDEHHYIARVRRARIGDAVEIVDGEGRRANARIASITDGATLLDVAAPETIPPLAPHVRCLVPPIKGDRMDICVEKLVEVGVDSIVLWPAARAVVKLDADRRESRLAKLTSQLQAAARQSGRARVPTIEHAASLAAAIESLPDGARFVLDPQSDSPLARVGADDVTFVSGPEGGLAPAELELLQAHRFVAIGLGPNVLRAETAPIVAVVQLRAFASSVNGRA